MSQIHFFKRVKPEDSGNDRGHFFNARPVGRVFLEKNCLYFFGATSPKSKHKQIRKYQLTWPWNFSLQMKDGVLHVFDANNNKLVKVGSQVSMYGGYMLTENVNTNYIDIPPHCQQKGLHYTFHVNDINLL